MNIANVRYENYSGLAIIEDDDACLIEEWPSTDAYIKEETDPGERRRRLESALGKARRVPVAAVSFLPALTSPGKIVCIGLNYRRHAEETGAPIPQHPVVFSKFSDVVAAHQEAVEVPRETAQLDYEGELAMVVGDQCWRVEESEALKRVFGYCNANDFSARDLQFTSSQWLLGKTLPRFAPLGPFIKTADQVPNPDDLEIKTYRNHDLVQHSNTKDMIFSCAQIIAYVSRHFVLRAGDVILTGTPEGVVVGKPPEERRWLEPGERLTVAIEGLGRLENTLISG